MGRYVVNGSFFTFYVSLTNAPAAQVPAVILLTTYWRHDLVGLYTGMAIGYLVLVILYSAIAFTSDYEKYAKIAKERTEK